jgi:hypothetical protein
VEGGGEGGRERGRERGGEGDASVRTWACPRGRIYASTRTRFLPRRWAVKTRPPGKRGRGWTSGRRLGRHDGNFPLKSSFMTSLRTGWEGVRMGRM